MQPKTHRKVFSSLLAASMLLSPATTLVVAANELTDSTSQPVNSQSNNSSTIIYEYSTENGNGEIELKSESVQIRENVLTITKSGTYRLTGNTKCSIIVGSEEEGTEKISVTLDLGGYKLTNIDDQHTITVHKGASLTIQGNGTVDNVSHGKAAVYNEGNVELLGGTYSRSEEKSNNTYYTIENHGEMQIGSNERENSITVMHDSKDGTTTSSSLVKNGGNARKTGDYAEYKSSLTVYNGSFYGGVSAMSLS